MSSTNFKSSSTVSSFFLVVLKICAIPRLLLRQIGCTKFPISFRNENRGYPPHFKFPNKKCITRFPPSKYTLSCFKIYKVYLYIHFLHVFLLPLGKSGKLKSPTTLHSIQDVFFIFGGVGGGASNTLTNLFAVVLPRNP